jgi:hypothetical protein
MFLTTVSQNIVMLRPFKLYKLYIYILYIYINYIYIIIYIKIIKINTRIHATPASLMISGK